MDELKAVIMKLLPEGSEVKKIYKDAAGQIVADVNMAGIGEMTCAIKKNHAGEIYLD